MHKCYRCKNDYGIWREKHKQYICYKCLLIYAELDRLKSGLKLKQAFEDCFTDGIEPF